MLFTWLHESILNLVFVPFTSNVTNQSSDVEFTSYVFRLCVVDCVLVVMLPTKVCYFSDRDESVILHDFHNVFVWRAHFCKVFAFFAGVADLVVNGAVASKVWAWTEFAFCYFISVREGISALCESEFFQAFFRRLVAVFFIFVKFTSLGSLCRSSTCRLVASAVWPAFIANSSFW